ncbi:MAG: hypothetical protein EOR03_24215 [Mesorhizobium sp.]|nr:MAG: hypothetical protein EOR03_24215 [Mesorhizobium sp.]
MDPHPNPPHKGEGTLPLALTSSFGAVGQTICRGQRQRKSPSPCGEGLWVGVHRRAKASGLGYVAGQMRL